MFNGLLLVALMVTSKTFAFSTGFNQGWMKENYARQFDEKNYDHNEAKRLIDLVQLSGSGILRMWLFEGCNNSILKFDSEMNILAITEDGKKNIIDFLGLARNAGIQVYLTLFDAHSKCQSHENRNTRQSYYTLYNNQLGKLDSFLNHVLSDLLSAIARAGLVNVVYAFDVINEGDTLVYNFAFKNPRRFSTFVNKVRKHIKSHPEFQASKVTASIRWKYFNPAITLLKKRVDFIDIHVYDSVGKIEGCHLLQILVPGKDVILGEFGQFSKAFSDEIQLRTTRNFIFNAKKCGLKAALGWRLSDIREGHNPEARFSFEAYGVLRPAFQFVRTFNQNTDFNSLRLQ